MSLPVSTLLRTSSGLRRPVARSLVAHMQGVYALSLLKLGVSPRKSPRYYLQLAMRPLKHLTLPRRTSMFQADVRIHEFDQTDHPNLRSLSYL